MSGTSGPSRERTWWNQIYKPLAGVSEETKRYFGWKAGGIWRRWGRCSVCGLSAVSKSFMTVANEGLVSQVTLN
jgi:hypothetical protein